MTHDTASRRLSAFLDNELPAEERSAIQSHLADCPICAATLHDLEFISKTVRQLRAMFRLTQENLAHAANLSTRTIEKVESGRHKPDEQTLRSIARGFGGINMEVFRKRTPEEEAEMEALNPKAPDVSSSGVSHRPHIIRSSKRVRIPVLGIGQRKE